MIEKRWEQYFCFAGGGLGYLVSHFISTKMELSGAMNVFLVCCLAFIGALIGLGAYRLIKKIERSDSKEEEDVIRSKNVIKRSDNGGHLMKEYHWNDNLISLNFLLHSEEQAAKDTLSFLKEDSTEFINLVNIFFRLSYHCKEDVTPDSDEHYFLTEANLKYLRLPYSLHAIYDLWLKGYYLEAVLIYRHILEGIVSLRYFYSHKDKLKAHLGIITPRKRVRFHTMFEEIVPGFYERYYGRIFSDIAHGGPSTIAFRAKYSSPTNGDIIMGCEFNLNHSRFVSRSTMLVSYGYLNYISVFFPSIMSKINLVMSKRIQEMSKHIEDKYLNQPKDDFAKIISPLICK